MSKSTYLNANLNPNYDTFASWLDKTNHIVYDMGTTVLTINTSANPDITSGNGFVNGYFGANVVYVTSVLQGGTANTPGTLTINTYTNVINTLAVGTTGGNVVANSTTVSFVNSSATATINSTSYTGTSANSVLFAGVSLATVNNAITVNASAAYTNAVANAAYVAGVAYSNAVANASYQAGVAYANAVANAAATYQTCAGLSANVATLTANAATYLGSANLTTVQSYITSNSGAAYTNAVNYVTTGLGNGSIVAANSLYANNSGGVGGIVVNTTSPSDGYVLAYDQASSKIIFKNPSNISVSLNSNTVVANAQLQAGSNGSTYVLTVTGNTTSTNVVARANTISLTSDTTLTLNSSAIVTSTFYAGNTAANVNISTGTITIQSNSSTSATVNATTYTGTALNANNSTYLGGSTLSTVQNQITGNAATAYANAVANAAALYQTTAGLSANVATLTANAAGYLGNSSGTIANISSWISGNSATAYSNAVSNAASSAAALYQTSAGLSANVATLTANNATNLGGAAASAYVNTSGAFALGGVITFNANVSLTSGNGTNQILISTINATSVGLLANSTVLTIGNSSVYSVTNSTSFSRQANGATYFGTEGSGVTLSTLQSQITSNAATAYSNAVANTSYQAGVAYSNATTFSANASNITSGTVAAARLGSGTANSSTILYGNNVWGAAPSAVNTSAQYTWSNTQTFSSGVIATGNVGIQNTAPATSLQIGGNYGIVATTIASTNNININCASGNYFLATANGSSANIYFTSTPANTAYGLTLILSNGGSNTLVWANTPKWGSGLAPILTASGVDILTFFTNDGGITWRGTLMSKDSR